MNTSIWNNSTISGAATAQSLVLTVNRLRALMRLSVIALIIAIFVPWPLQLGSAQFNAVDIVATCSLVFMSLYAVCRGKFRASRPSALFLSLFGFWCVWLVFSWFYHPYGKSPPSLIWHIYKNVGVFIVAPLLGMFASRQGYTFHAQLLKAMLVMALLVASVGITQTLSASRLFSGLLTNQRYLGFLTPLPRDLFDTFIQDLDVAAQTGSDSYFVGNVFRAHGTLLHSNPFAALMSASAAFALGAYLRGDRRHAKRSFVLSSVATLATIGIGGYVSISAAVLYGAGRVSMVVNQFRKRRVTVLVSAALIGIVAISVSSFLAYASTSEDANLKMLSGRLARITMLLDFEQSGGFNGRFAAWSLVIERVVESPLFGGLKPVTTLEAGWTNTETPLGAHNSYLVVALYGGLPAALIFVALLLWALFETRNSRLQQLNLTQRQIIYGTHLFLVALLVNGISTDWISDSSIAMLFWFLSGFAVGCLRPAGQTKVRYAP